MGYQLDNARTRNGRTIWVPCLQVASQQPRISMGLNVDHPEMHGIYGIECGPFGYNEYGFPRVDTQKPVASYGEQK